MGAYQSVGLGLGVELQIFPQIEQSPAGDFAAHEAKGRDDFRAGLRRLCDAIGRQLKDYKGVVARVAQRDSSSLRCLFRFQD